MFRIFCLVKKMNKSQKVSFIYNIQDKLLDINI